jgi:hypothetical protein
MKLVTIGLDFGTSSVKCIARPSMGQPCVLRSPTGAVRWRSMLGRVREGTEAGRLLLFEECDEERWRFAALVEANLKLALLIAPTSPAADALRSRWQCEHFALPTLLLGAALQQAMRMARTQWPGRAIHVFCGAPVSPMHPPEQTLIFERALFAAHLLAEKWGDVVPRDAVAATREAEQAWRDSAALPSEEDRSTFVVPEAFAACEGVVSAGGGAGLPIGRLCIVDMGGGTTDIAWVANRGTDSYNPLRIESIDVAGERLEAVLATRASQLSGRRVTRQEVWQARRDWRADEATLRGAGWALEFEEIRSLLARTLDELKTRFARGLQQLDGGSPKAPATKFIFVGGATHWEPLARLLLESVEVLHERTEVISVAGYGLSEASGDTPMAVALGLSNGHTTLDLERWEPALQASVEAPAPAEIKPLAFCPCNGLLPCCPKCGGSGTKCSEDGRDRFAASIDPFAVHAFSVRCPHCRLGFPRDRIFEHLAREHQVSPPSPPASRQAAIANPQSLRVDELRRALSSGDERKLTPSEALLVSDLRWMQSSCFASPDERRALAVHFLRRSVVWSQRFAWFHLPRAVAFGMVGDAQGVATELGLAKAAGFQNCHEVGLQLESSRQTRFAEAWECAVR